jgi:hypothetical protein
VILRKNSDTFAQDLNKTIEFVARQLRNQQTLILAFCYNFLKQKSVLSQGTQLGAQKTARKNLIKEFTGAQSGKLQISWQKLLENFRSANENSKREKIAKKGLSEKLLNASGKYLGLAFSRLVENNDQFLAESNRYIQNVLTRLYFREKNW